MDFEWDESKNAANQSKHGISFEEACELFEGDSDPLELFEGRYEDGDVRFRAIGPIRRGLIFVVFSEPQEDAIRIISARFADAEEVDMYLEYRNTELPDG